MTSYRLPPWPQPAPGEPAAAPLIQEHFVCGLAASLGRWRPDQFTRFLDWFGGGRDGERVWLRLDHEPDLITPRGVEPANVGEALRFASVPAGDGFPGGLLVLGVLYPDFAPGILAAMHRRRQWMAMSVGGAEHVDLTRGDGDLWLNEVSLVSAVGDQADPDALVVGTGPGAEVAWELLSGEAVSPGVTAFPALCEGEN